VPELDSGAITQVDAHKHIMPSKAVFLLAVALTSLALLVSEFRFIRVLMTSPRNEFTNNSRATTAVSQISQGHAPSTHIDSRKVPVAIAQTDNAPAPETPIESFHYPVNLSKNYSQSLPVPVQIMEHYIRMHSVDALRRDPDIKSRKFAMAFYQCPIQAGNRLHHFWNNLLWAVLTNRTVLWQYWDTETCSTYDGKLMHKHFCIKANTADDCSHILQRAPWMASYDEWKDVILEPGEEPFPVPYHATNGRVRNFIRQGWYPEPVTGLIDYVITYTAKTLVSNFHISRCLRAGIR
jgi:hypothetical protein